MSDGTSQHEKAIDAGLLLPGQYADLVRRNHVIEGELKLLLAVLEDAIRCYLRYAHVKDGERRREFIDVRNWFEGARAGVLPPGVRQCKQKARYLAAAPRLTTASKRFSQRR